MLCILFFFFFKQKTAYEMRISDWSSDVCSSDLRRPRGARHLDQSDQDHRQGHIFAEIGMGAHPRDKGRLARVAKRHLFPRPDLAHPVAKPDVDKRSSAAVIRDRKSTRLNSSH